MSSVIYADFRKVKTELNANIQCDILYADSECILSRMTLKCGSLTFVQHVFVERPRE